MLLAAARHYASWGNARPRVTVHGDGSEATIVMRNTRPDDPLPSRAASLGDVSVSRAPSSSPALGVVKEEEDGMDAALGIAGSQGLQSLPEAADGGGLPSSSA
eukprot:11550411-Alexandrium_andersonii.AAC.1